MNEEIRLHLEEAEDCLAQADLLLTSSHPGASISRAYYGMFHAATAALLHCGVERSSPQSSTNTCASHLIFGRTVTTVP